MQVGDPKKTAVLAIVAVGAIGFLFTRITGGGDGPKQLRQAAGTADPNATVSGGGTVVAMQVEPLRNDPFSHPKLSPRGSNGQPAVTTDPPPSNPFENAGKTHMPEIFIPPAAGNGGIDKVPPPDWPKPIEPGKRPDEIKIEKLTQVTLRMIVKVNDRMAYLSVDNSEPRGYRIGDVIKDDLTVVMVNDDSVILKNTKRTLTLKVGQQGDL